MPLSSRFAYNFFLPPILVLMLHFATTPLYGVWSHYDVATHTLGGIAIGWSFQTLMDALGLAIPRWFRLFLGLGIVALAATVWEFMEFFLDLHTGYSLRQISIANTMKDMAMGLAGSIIASLAYLYFPKNKQKMSQ